jgi:hypothetical protein
MPCVYLPGPAPAVTVANNKGLRCVCYNFKVLILLDINATIRETGKTNSIYCAINLPLLLK